MPSRFRLREKLGLGQSSRDGASLSGLSTALSVQTVSTTTAATSTTTTAPLTTTAASSTRTAATLSQNFAFTNALQQYLAKLGPDENSAFRTSHQTLTAESILMKVRDYDRNWNHNSNSRKCAEQVEKSLRILNQFLRSIAIAVQSNPEISSLTVGA